MLSRNKISSSVSAVSGAGLAIGATVSGIRIPSNREWQTCNFSIGGNGGWLEIEVDWGRMATGADSLAVTALRRKSYRGPASSRRFAECAESGCGHAPPKGWRYQV